MNCLVLMVILYLQYITGSHGTYYWRGYKNKIPSDAYVAGRDSNNANVYIGQSLLYDDGLQGLYPTTLVEGKEVYVPRIGARKANYFIQILCSSSPGRFVWLPANSGNLHSLNTDNELIRGGIEYLHGEVNIGRIEIKGNSLIGKIMLDVIGGADMWFVQDGEEKKAISYEVLTYTSKKRVMGNGTVIYTFD